MSGLMKMMFDPAGAAAARMLAAKSKTQSMGRIVERSAKKQICTQSKYGCLILCSSANAKIPMFAFSSATVHAHIILLVCKLLQEKKQTFTGRPS